MPVMHRSLIGSEARQDMIKERNTSERVAGRVISMNFEKQKISGILADIGSKGELRWAEIAGFLPEDVFKALNDNYPDINKFEKHAGIERVHGQRPHDRYYLAYESSIYGSDKDAEGLISQQDLPEVWQDFIEMLSSDEDYLAFVRETLQVDDFDIRFAWHMAFDGCEVSPHLDARQKYGTHLFYFNTDANWQPDWGGGTVLLAGKKTKAMNPDFFEFERKLVESEIINNKSFIFQNSPQAWHGVKKISAPEGKYRRLFTVVFDKKGARERTRERLPLHKKLLRKLSKLWA